MKKVKLFYIFILLVLLSVVQVSAIDTEIKIKTLPFHEVQVAVAKPMSSTFESWGNFKNYSDQYGDVSFVFSSDKYTFDLIVYIKKDNEKIMPAQRFLENFPVGDPIYLEIAPAGFEFIETPGEVIEEVENETIIEENEIEPEVTGSAIRIFGEEGIFSKKITYYIIGIIILLGVGAFVIIKIIKKRPKTSKDIKIKKLSELQDEKKEKLQDKEGIIEDAEKKIKEAQEDIRKIRNEGKIKEARQKLIDDEKELVKLREGKK